MPIFMGGLLAGSEGGSGVRRAGDACGRPQLPNRPPPLQEQLHISTTVYDEYAEDLGDDDVRAEPPRYRPALDLP
jgi:hypothetical protein